MINFIRQRQVYNLLKYDIILNSDITRADNKIGTCVSKLLKHFCHNFDNKFVKLTLNQQLPTQ